MDRNQGVFPALCAIFTETTLLCSTFTIFGATQSNSRIEILLVPWLLWALAASLFFYWYLGKETSVRSLTIIGTILYITGAFILLFFFSSLGGVASWLIGLLFLLLTLWRSIALQIKRPSDDSRYLAYVQWSAIGAVTFLFLQAGPTKLGAAYDFCLLASVLLNFLALIRNRIVSEKNATITLSRLQGISLLFSGATVLAAFLLSLLWLGSSSLQQALGALISRTGQLLSAIGKALKAAIVWLFSMFPEPATPEPLEMPGNSTPQMPEAEWDAMPLLPDWAIPAAALFLVLSALIITVFLFRKVRLKKAPIKRKVARITIKSKKKRPSVFTHLRFRTLAFLQRNTPQGMLVYLERWGAHRKAARGVGETHRDFLQRLTTLSETLQTEEAQQLLFHLSMALDTHYYGSKGTQYSPVFEAEKAVALRRLLHRKLKRPHN